MRAVRIEHLHFVTILQEKSAVAATLPGFARLDGIAELEVHPAAAKLALGDDVAADFFCLLFIVCRAADFHRTTLNQMPAHRATIRVLPFVEIFSIKQHDRALGSFHPKARRRTHHALELETRLAAMAAAPAADAILGNLTAPTISLEADHSVSESAGADEVSVGARIMLLEKLDEIFAVANIDHLRGERFVDVEILFLRRIKPTAFVIAHQGKVGAGDLRPIGRLTLGREATRYQKCAHESRAVKHDKCAVHGFFSVIHAEMASGQEI